MPHQENTALHRAKRPLWLATGAIVSTIVAGCYVSAPQPSLPEITDPASSPATSDSATTDSASGTPQPSSTTTEIPNWPPTLSKPTTLAKKLSSPWSVVPVEGALLVSQRDSGKIVQINADGTKRDVFQMDQLEFASGGECGLLGLAYDREFGLFAYTSTEHDNRVIKFDVTVTGSGVALTKPIPVMTGIPQATTHNGGRLAFGPDRKLYVTTGDSKDPNTAQAPDNLGGKILRINPDGTTPQDNPNPESPVWSLGHRNVQGIAWSADGTMFATEFGAHTWDELNIIEPGGNYGWPEVEGIAGVDGYIDPVQQWPTDQASPSGMAIVNDTIFIANLRGESIRAVPVASPNASQILFTDQGRIRDVVAADGHTLLVLTNNTDGRGKARARDDLLLELRTN